MQEPLYDPRNRPVTAVNSAQDSMSLPPGVLASSSNLRFSDGIIKCRGGMTASLGTLLTNGKYRGHWEGVLWGAHYAIVAMYDGSSKTRVYRSTDYATWTEITASSGPWGDTRLTGNAPVTFAVVADPFSLPTTTNTERILFTDGTGAVRVAAIATTTRSYGLTNGTIYTATLADITPPSIGDTSVQVQTLATHIEFPTGSYTNSPNDFEGSTVGSAPNVQQRLSIFSTIDNGDTVSGGYASHIALGAQLVDRQILIGVDTSYTMLWDKVKVTMGSQVLWDPSSPSLYTRPVPVPFDNSQRMIWIFTSPATLTGSISGTLTFTWAAATNEAPATTQTADIFLIGITHGTPSKADWSIAQTYAQSFSNAESAAVIHSNYETQRISDFGGPILSGARLPRSPLFQAQYVVKVKNPSTAQVAAGVDICRFYYKSPGAERFRYVMASSGPSGNSPALTQFTAGAWALLSGSAGDILGDRLAAVDSDFYNVPTAYMPDAYNITVPTSKCIAYVNDRLLAGGGVGANRTLYISEYKNAFRMRRFTAYQNGTVDADAPLTLGIGAAIVQKIVPMASSILGSDSVFVFTDCGVLMTGGTTSAQLQRLARVSQFGTLSPNSIRELNGNIFYLDTEMQVRVMAGGAPQSITRGVVDDVLHGIPAARRPFVSAAVHREFYYLAYTPSGATTNTRILVWDDVAGMWCFDTPKVAAEGLISVLDGTNNAKRLLLIGTDGKAYEYDLSTENDDDGTAIACSMRFWELHNPDGENFTIQKLGITCDQQTGGTGTVTVTYKPTGNAATYALDLASASDDQIVRWSAAPASASEGVTAVIDLALNLSAGSRIQRILVDKEDTGEAHDTSL